MRGGRREASNDQIDLLPLAGRDYTGLLRLVPGAAANNASYGFGVQLANIPQRTAPNTQILNSLFGAYTAVSQPRALQFTLQYDF